MTKQSWLPRLILTLFAFSASHALANTSDSADLSCGQVHVDCSAHEIDFPGIKSLKGPNCGDPTKIDCGAATVNGKGTIGGKHSGPIVPDGIEIDNIPGMGASGGGKVFHTTNPKNPNTCPKGVDNSLGCIHICKAVLDKLKTCKGSSLIIAGAQGKKNNGPRDPSQPGGKSKNSGTTAMLDGNNWQEGLARRVSLNKWIALGGLVQCSARAQETPDPLYSFIMDEHQMIDITNYDPATRTFEVVNLKYWGQGPLITTPEELAKSVDAIKLHRLQRNPASFIHSQYMTDHGLLMLLPELVDARRH